MKRSFLAAATAICLCTTSAHAGPVAEFELAFGDMYSSYRSALFATNSGDAEKSAKALKALDTKWAELTSVYANSPPPQYQDDPQWSQMIADVTGYLEQAESEAAAGQLPVAHVTLEAIREEFGSLHGRNGVQTFSDRMNAYHAEMEHVLELDLSGFDDAAANRVLEHAGVLGYLADDVLALPPAQAAGNAEYEPLAAAFRASVDQFVEAARARDGAAVQSAVAGLKVPYSKFFLKFG